MVALIAQDDPISKIIVERCLTKHGWEVCKVTDGVEALETYKRGSFNLVITDVSLPKMHGVSLIKHILALKDRPRPYTVLIADHLIPKNQKASLSAYVDDLIFKPLEDSYLNTRMELAKKFLDARQELEVQIQKNKEKDELIDQMSQRFSDIIVDIPDDVIDTLNRFYEQVSLVIQETAKHVNDQDAEEFRLLLSTLKLASKDIHADWKEKMQARLDKIQKMKAS